ncbi:TfdA [Klebsiella pneumoniae]|uniref:TauD/TfdA family dioxygenase n=1 Tax=Klebsiella pneumoniae TaxID=573 RepID=UPI001BABE618|nr:TauD/TfdA family dioxygenase [Klebsiella pneumoniae]MBQ5265125.1 TfdA [Klebsiella pneumoniae]
MVMLRECKVSGLAGFVVNGLSVTDTQSFFSEAAPEIRDALLSNGALILRGVAHSTEPAVFETIMSALGFHSRDYIGGSSPRSTVKGKVMEATRTPPAWSIILHQEMAYVKHPPEIIAFSCVIPAAEGGQSTVGDMRRLRHLLPSETLQILTERGLRLRRTLPHEERVHLKPGIKKSWQEALSAETKEEAELACHTRHWEFEWWDDDLILWQDCISPVRQHPQKNELFWCNQAHFWGAAAMIEWARIDARREDETELTEAVRSCPELLESMCFGDGEPLPGELTLSLFHLVQELEQDVNLNTGDILLLDNLQFAHGRRAFAGKREINVLIADWGEM